MAAATVLGATGCSGSQAGQQNQQEESQQEGVTDVTGAEVQSSAVVLYFSCTGNTDRVARSISGAINGAIMEITALEGYTDDDLDYGNDESRTSKEQNDETCRPEVAAIPDLSLYDTVFLGSPIWWGTMPRLMCTLVESGCLDGLKVIPFVTSAQSGIEQAQKDYQALSSKVNWVEGKRFAASAMQDEVSEWAKGVL